MLRNVQNLSMSRVDATDRIFVKRHFQWNSDDALFIREYTLSLRSISFLLWKDEAVMSNKLNQKSQSIYPTYSWCLLNVLFDSCMQIITNFSNASMFVSKLENKKWELYLMRQNTNCYNERHAKPNHFICWRIIDFKLMAKQLCALNISNA